MKARYQALGLAEFPVVLAPLAGVSDHPFRRICARLGADLTYVEMISATALCYQSRRTLDMLTRHGDESRLGVQITGKTPEEVAQAIGILSGMSFDTIDINMGCPVRKVVGAGCGSGILQDLPRLQRTVEMARAATNKPLSVKIRLGWDRTSINALEVTRIAQEGGADWLTVHGRTRADDYSVPVDLHMIGRIKSNLTIPVWGNGNLFSTEDIHLMGRYTGVDGVMISRGALGNPWVFAFAKGRTQPVTVDEWTEVVLTHLKWQEEAYGNAPGAAICMRKHLLWYAKGWPGAKKLREEINTASDLKEAARSVETFATALLMQGIRERLESPEEAGEARFQWDPKWEMDRRLDRGIGDDGLDSAPQF